jgi:2-oxoisovalerate dehydrogenase E2 component (dihydrolipoyl transacylase)
MVRHEITMPDIGEGVTEAEITEWLVNTGDLVREDDPLVAVMTDKATVEIPSPVDGRIVSIFGALGEVIAVGETIIILEAASVADSTAPKSVGSDTQLAPEAMPQEATPTTGMTHADRPIAAPAVRRRAKESGVDLTRLSGSGSGGRITAADLDAWIGNLGMDGAVDDVEEIKIVGLRRQIAQNMLRSSQNIAHMTYVEAIDVTDLQEMRAKINAERIANGHVKLTILPFLMIAIIQAVEKNPKVNAHYNDQASMLRQFRHVHLGMATQTPAGLMVPVIHNAETLDIPALAAEITRLAAGARAGSIDLQELRGSTLTLSNLGRLGGIMSTPIINAPEVAVIGVNKITTQPVWRDASFVPRQIMNLSASFDHRIIDGWDAAVYIQDVKALMEKPTELAQFN